jgi:hypothetical protein
MFVLDLLSTAFISNLLAPYLHKITVEKIFYSLLYWWILATLRAVRPRVQGFFTSKSGCCAPPTPIAAAFL